jgi:hypothetical protein
MTRYKGVKGGTKREIGFSKKGNKKPRKHSVFKALRLVGVLLQNLAKNLVISMVTEPPISEITSKTTLRKHPNGIIPQYFSCRNT